MIKTENLNLLTKSNSKENLNQNPTGELNNKGVIQETKNDKDLINKENNNQKIEVHNTPLNDKDITFEEIKKTISKDLQNTFLNTYSDLFNPDDKTKVTNIQGVKDAFNKNFLELKTKVVNLGIQGLEKKLANPETVISGITEVAKQISDPNNKNTKHAELVAKLLQSPLLASIISGLKTNNNEFIPDTKSLINEVKIIEQKFKDPNNKDITTQSDVLNEILKKTADWLADAIKGVHTDTIEEDSPIFQLIYNTLKLAASLVTDTSSNLSIAQRISAFGTTVLGPVGFAIAIPLKLLAPFTPNWPLKGSVTSFFAVGLTWFFQNYSTMLYFDKNHNSNIRLTTGAFMGAAIGLMFEWTIYMMYMKIFKATSDNTDKKLN